jgi:hypothetical protein
LVNDSTTFSARVLSEATGGPIDVHGGETSGGRVELWLGGRQRR